MKRVRLHEGGCRRSIWQCNIYLEDRDLRDVCAKSGCESLTDFQPTRAVPTFLDMTMPTPLMCSGTMYQLNSSSNWASFLHWRKVLTFHASILVSDFALKTESRV